VLGRRAKALQPLPIAHSLDSASRLDSLSPAHLAATSLGKALPTCQKTVNSQKDFLEIYNLSLDKMIRSNLTLKIARAL
jgi:hypothetical protein